MLKQRLTGHLGLASIALVIGFASSADGQQPNGSANENTEVMIGSYYCGVSSNSPEAWVYYSFEASGDVFQRAPYLYRQYTDATSTPEFCDSLAAASAELLTQSGCSVGAIEVSGDDSGWSREFRFVCHAKRSRIISNIAEISEQIITASP
ncbi:MAG: hypothetical protein JRE38_12585 [Deltaproteobacteria bacterium]|nr:hypothetical protein [Deltaproteobacteria bacterium]MBW2578886.1 hypothetical protein [Deltaproteobacteria bacterium]MBW2692430.1 hypothetical protein [Deltaproteobacteria bacterium]